MADSSGENYFEDVHYVTLVCVCVTDIQEQTLHLLAAHVYHSNKAQ